jgi:NAD(P)-dependent dehydrogenase (short-subunit alcohol dehydrogenase family)
MNNRGWKQPEMLALGAALAGGAWLLRTLTHRKTEADLTDHVALITGGSRGLGLLLAKEFARCGCRIAICARDEEELKRAEAEIATAGGTAFSVPCDLTDRAQTERMVQKVLDHYDGIDILVNSTGTIGVGPVQKMQVEDFEQAMASNFYGVLHAIWAVLPHMRQRRTGRIVNISSVGGRVPVPHLLPYSCSKFAVTALSEGLRAELRRDNIVVTTIMPGTMRTGSHVQAMVKGQQEAEYRLFTLAATLPLVSLAAEEVARQVVKATRRGESERVVGLPAQTMTMMHGLFPGVMADMFGCINLFVLPSPEGSSEYVRGAEVAACMDPLYRQVTVLGEKAAERLNQSPPAPSLNS